MANVNYEYNPSFGAGFGGQVPNVYEMLKKFGFQGNNAMGAIRTGMLPGLMGTYLEQSDPSLGARRAAAIAQAEEAATASGRNARNIREQPSWANDPLLQGQRQAAMKKNSQSMNFMDYMSELMKLQYNRGMSGYRPSQLADWELYDSGADTMKYLLSAGY